MQSRVGAKVKHVMLVTPDEDTLWASKVIGDYNPPAFQKAVFFCSGKTFCLRSGKEQRSLTPLQFIPTWSPDCYTYVENGSKSKSGVSLKETNTIIPVYANLSARLRCLVYLLDKYFSKFPPKGKDMDVLYLCCISKKPADKDKWYECSPVGKKSFKILLEVMRREVGISQKKTI